MDFNIFRAPPLINSIICLAAYGQDEEACERTQLYEAAHERAGESRRLPLETIVSANNLVRFDFEHRVAYLPHNDEEGFISNVNGMKI